MPLPDDPPLAVAVGPRPAARAVAVAALAVPQAVLLLVQGAAPLLLREAPLVLLALHPFAPWSLLVAARTDLLTFTAVTVAARTVPACGGYLVGRWYGPAALDRLRRRRAARPARSRPARLRLARLRVPGLARLRGAARLQRLAPAGPGVLLVVYPGSTASLLSGASGLRPRTFLPLMWAGLVLGAVANRALASLFERPLSAAGDLVGGHALVLGAVLLVASALVEVVRRRSRR